MGSSRTTLTKWGNSQGVRIPKSVCEQLGASVGDEASIDYGPANSITISFNVPRYARHRKVPIEEYVKDITTPVVSEEPFGDDVGDEAVL